MKYYILILLAIGFSCDVLGAADPRFSAESTSLPGKTLLPPDGIHVDSFGSPLISKPIDAVNPAEEERKRITAEEERKLVHSAALCIVATDQKRAAEAAATEEARQNFLIAAQRMAAEERRQRLLIQQYQFHQNNLAKVEENKKLQIQQ